MNCFTFIDHGVSPFHVVAQSVEELRQQGFVPLEESDKWEIVPGGKYFVTRNQSSIVAFAVPTESPKQYHIVASHSDSPTFCIKKHTVSCKGYGKAEVEGYGGMIHSSWLDRPLSLAGRVLVKTAEGIESRLVNVDRDLFVIPNLSIHFNREINKGYSYNPQVDLQPICGEEGADFSQILEELACLKEGEEIVDDDLVLAVRQKATSVGVNQEFFMAPRIDDLGCAYTSLEAFLRSAKKVQEHNFNAWCVLDNEEVGSGTRQGALSNFVPDVLTRVEHCLGLDFEQARQLRSRSLLVSADNAHATHPNLPEKSDMQFPIYLNKGIVVKYNASQKYTTTGMTAAVFEQICQQAGVEVQHFANRADAPGGSTLGNLLSQQFSVPMLDIGLPQLAMHSAVETAGTKDIQAMCLALTAFYDSNVSMKKDGTWKI